MDKKRSFYYSKLSIFFLAVLFYSPIYPATVLHHPEPDTPLQKRWEWAVRQGIDQDCEEGYWIGFSIQKWMGVHSFIGSFSWPRRAEEVTLNERLFNITVEDLTPDYHYNQTVGKAAQRSLDKMDDSKHPEPKILKDVALLFLLLPAKSGNQKIHKIKISNLSLHVELDRFPVIWLGKAKNDESIALLNERYQNTDSDNQKKKLITAIGIHETSKQATAFLAGVLSSKESDDLRGKAASWLGEQHNQEALNILFKTVRSDRSLQVRKKAVYALGEHGTEEAVDALKTIIQSDQHESLRKAGLYALAESGYPDIVAFFESIACHETDVTVAKAATFALEDIGGSKAIEALEQIVKNGKQTAVRKAALYTLGDLQDDKALELLKAVALENTYPELSKAAIYAMGDIDTELDFQVAEFLFERYRDRFEYSEIS